MSLGRLLTSGKSLIGLQNQEGRYEMRSKNLLPKFGSEKNPFTTAKPQPLQVESGRKLPTVPRSLTPGEAAAATMKETKRLPQVKAVMSDGPQIRKPAGPGKFMEVTMRWVKKLNPLSWFGGKSVKGNSAVPRFDKLPVQGELSLDRIRVVRNDLSEADVEVVPVKISVQPRVEPVVQPVAKPAVTPELIKT